MAESHVCSKCGVDKPLTEYYQRKSGYLSRCKSCGNTEAVAWGKANRERHAKSSKEWRLANPESVAKTKKAFREANAAQLAADAKAYREANPEKVATQKKAGAEQNKAGARARYALNPEKGRASSRSWRAANPDKVNAQHAKREAAKIQQTPSWANDFFIEEIYDLAQRRTKATGFEWQVDHIVPLRGKSVRGLHVENNLRVIPAVVNLAKGNRHWPDMPEARL